MFSLISFSLQALACPVPLTSDPTDWKTERFVTVLAGFFQCNPTDPVNDQSPCNRFVAKGVAKIYGINDFSDLATEYINANNMIKIMEKSNSGWQKIRALNIQVNADCAQALANKGYAVIAGLQQQNHGHVAMVIAGQVAASSNWGIKVPNSAAFTLGNVDQSYVSEKLSKTFSPEDAANASYYFKKP